MAQRKVLKKIWIAQKIFIHANALSLGERGQDFITIDILFIFKKHN